MSRTSNTNRQRIGESSRRKTSPRQCNTEKLLSHSRRNVPMRAFQAAELEKLRKEINNYKTQQSEDEVNHSCWRRVVMNSNETVGIRKPIFPPPSSPYASPLSSCLQVPCPRCPYAALGWVQCPVTSTPSLPLGGKDLKMEEDQNSRAAAFMQKVGSESYMKDHLQPQNNSWKP